MTRSQLMIHHEMNKNVRDANNYIIALVIIVVIQNISSFRTILFPSQFNKLKVG